MKHRSYSQARGCDHFRSRQPTEDFVVIAAYSLFNNGFLVKYGYYNRDRMFSKVVVGQG